MGHAFTLNPDLQFTMLTYRVDLGSFTCPPDRALWDKVVGELELVQQQIDEVAACWEISNQSMVRNTMQRCGLSGRLDVRRLYHRQCQCGNILKQTATMEPKSMPPMSIIHRQSRKPSS